MTAPTTRETAGHAELARRLREDADWQRKMKGGTTNDRMLDQAADALENLLSEIAALRGEAENARTLVAQANNSLFASFGYFHGEPFDALHLARPIEDLKQRAAQAERQRDELRSEGQKFADFIIQMNAPDQGECLTEDERLMFAVASKFRAFISNQGADQ